LPKITKYYIFSVFCVTFTITYNIIDYRIIRLNFNKTFQLWRLITNFLIVGKFSMNFLFFLLMAFQLYEKMESTCVKNKRYAEFIIMVFYVMSFLILITYFLEHTYFLSFELLFSILYIDCKRNPDQRKAIWGAFVVKNSYVPFALTFINLMAGGNILSDFVGIGVGHLYYFLKDYVPVAFGIDILKTPEFMFYLFDNKKKTVVNFTRLNNNENTQPIASQIPNYQASFRNNNTTQGNEYSPFNNSENPWS